jgi:hypothetical protein
MKGDDLKMLNSAQHESLHKSLPVGNEGAFSVPGQAIDHGAFPVKGHPGRDVIMWNGASPRFIDGGKWP